MYFTFLLFLVSANAYYLTFTQKQSIKNILQHSDNPVMKQKVKRLLVSKYSLWAINKARYFQKKYKIKPNYVRSTELIQSSLLGLVKSMKHYDGRVDVPYYSHFYIKKELYKCLTRCQPFGRFKHYEMMALKKKPMEHSRVEPIGDNQLYYQDVGPQYTFKYDDHQEIVFEELDKLSPRKKRVFLLTYDIHTLKKKRTAKEVAKLM